MTQETNKGGRPRKPGKMHKYIVPPLLEDIIKTYGIDYVWQCALNYHKLMHPNGH